MSQEGRSCDVHQGWSCVDLYSAWVLRPYQLCLDGARRQSHTHLVRRLGGSGLRCGLLHGRILAGASALARNGGHPSSSSRTCLPSAGKEVIPLPLPDFREINEDPENKGDDALVQEDDPEQQQRVSRALGDKPLIEPLDCRPGLICSIPTICQVRPEHHPQNTDHLPLPPRTCTGGVQRDKSLEELRDFLPPPSPEHEMGADAPHVPTDVTELALGALEEETSELEDEGDETN